MPFKEDSRTSDVIIIPAEGPDFEIFREKEVSVDRTKLCEHGIESFYYQYADNPVVCGWCCEALS